MTVKELIEQLKEMNPTAEVRFAFQPRNPFEYGVQDEIVQTEDESKVYIADAGQIDYLNSEVTNLLDWD